MSNSLYKGKTQSQSITKYSGSLKTSQAKYGVVIPPQQVQPAYGTVPIVQPAYGTVPIEVQPAYGVVPIVQPAYGTVPIDSQPKYGVATVQDINITYNQLEENISVLKNAINTLKDSWDGATKANINTLNNSWVGADCAAYTEKLTSMDNKVHNTIDSLDLLCSTYEKAKQMVQDRQTDVINTINNS